MPVGQRFKDRESSRLFLDYARGDAQFRGGSFSDKLFSPSVLQRGIQLLAERNPAIANSPEIRQRFLENLENFYQSDYGPQSTGSSSFQMPHYGVEDPFIQELYGVQAIIEEQKNVETDAERIDRLIRLAADLTAQDFEGIAQMSKLFETEKWGRQALGQIYTHENVDRTLLRNENVGEWTTLDRGVSTFDKSTQLINPRYESRESAGMQYPQAVFPLEGHAANFVDTLQNSDEILNNYF